ncbi:hypothetical protein [Chitinibacter sp. S2-10]|uniref:hypothetical protein n=1 Tax=Chitinibacter sp. S2-10 TaxID=3373597 RepID=UPI0039776A89
MALHIANYSDDLSSAIKEYLQTANAVLKRVDHLLTPNHIHPTAQPEKAYKS